MLYLHRIFGSNFGYCWNRTGVTTLYTVSWQSHSALCGVSPTFYSAYRLLKALHQLFICFLAFNRDEVSVSRGKIKQNVHQNGFDSPHARLDLGSSLISCVCAGFDSTKTASEKDTISLMPQSPFFKTICQI